MRPIPSWQDPDDPSDKSLIEWWRKRLGKAGASIIERGGSRSLLVMCAVLTGLALFACCWGVFFAVHR